MSSGADAAHPLSSAPPPADAQAAILGLAGPVLSAEERAFLRDAKPFGVILFARNVETPDQLRRLLSETRETLGWDVPALIDQEGGRVARLRPPIWRDWTPVGAWCAWADADPTREPALLDALFARGALIAEELRALGIDVNCAPLLDLRLPGAHDIIGDRALGPTPDAVARRARALADGQSAGGVASVIKHLPGHGRADLDSHLALPIVDASAETLLAQDIPAFAPLADAPYGMTAHVIYASFDPNRPATTSKAVLERTVRTAIGFDGVLMTDDLSMGALTGPMRARAADSLAAGCDVILHCNGDRVEAADALSAVGPLAGAAARRAAAALATRRAPDPIDTPAALAAVAALDRASA